MNFEEIAKQDKESEKRTLMSGLKRTKSEAFGLKLDSVLEEKVVEDEFE